MRDKLCVSERRTKILEFLVKKKQSTRCELATEFNVSTDTIDRDIVYLSGIAPVYTKQGNQGGKFIYCLNTEAIKTILQTKRKNVFMP